MKAIATERISIAVLAKAPIPGQAKTRMITRLGAAGAADLQTTLLQRTLKTVSNAQLGPVSLWCAPSREHPAFRACQNESQVALFDQQGSDLGMRMLRAFSILCPYGPVLLIGTDCPALSVAKLRLAADVLREGNDAVFLPAEDGGYVLIGLRRADPLLFDGIPWGTDRVMDETRQRLLQLGWCWAEPAILWDVDRPDDLDRLRASGLLDEWFRETGF